jgi:drug/metabolite transporter (DMT)-like permease
MLFFFLILIASVTGGSTPIAGKYILQTWSPFSGIFFRFLFATAALALTLSRPQLSFQAFKKNSTVAFIGAINPILFFLALPYIQASVSPLIYASVPLFTAVYNRVILRHRYTPKQIAGLVIGFSGVIMIVLLPLVNRGIPLAALKGNILILVGAVIFTLYGIMSQKAQEAHTISPRLMTYHFSLMTMLLSFPITLAEWFISPPTVQSFTYQSALKRRGTLSASLFTFLQPVATFSMAYFFLGEHISIEMIIGGMLAIMGSLMVMKQATEVQG